MNDALLVSNRLLRIILFVMLLHLWYLFDRNDPEYFEFSTYVIISSSSISINLSAYLRAGVLSILLSAAAVASPPPIPPDPEPHVLLVVSLQQV